MYGAGANCLIWTPPAGLSDPERPFFPTLSSRTTLHSSLFFGERILSENTQGPWERSGHCRTIDREPAGLDPFGSADDSQPGL